MLGFFSYVQGAKENQKNQDVVDAERLFDHVSGEKFHAGRVTLSKIDPAAESHGRQNG